MEDDLRHGLQEPDITNAMLGSHQAHQREMGANLENKSNNPDIAAEPDFWASMAGLGPWLADLGPEAASQMMGVFVERRRKLQAQSSDIAQKVEALNRMIAWLKCEMRRSVPRQDPPIDDRVAGDQQQQQQHRNYEEIVEHAVRDRPLNDPRVLVQSDSAPAHFQQFADAVQLGVGNNAAPGEEQDLENLLDGYRINLGVDVGGLFDQEHFDMERSLSDEELYNLDISPVLDAEIDRILGFL